MRMCHFWAQNGPFVMNKNFLVRTIIITFIYLLALLTVQNLKKFLQQIHIFVPKKVHVPQTIFFLKIINIILIYLLAPFIVQNFKKFFQQIQSYKNVQFFGPKMAPFLKSEFFSENMLLSLVSFIHAYLHAKNLSQILIY